MLESLFFFQWTWRDTFTIIVAIISGFVASQGTKDLVNLISHGKTSFEQVGGAIVDSIIVSEKRIIKDIKDIKDVDTTLVRHEEMLKDIQQKMASIDIQKDLTKRVDSLNQEIDKKFLIIDARLYYVEGHLNELTSHVLPDSLKDPIVPNSR